MPDDNRLNSVGAVHQAALEALMVGQVNSIRLRVVSDSMAPLLQSGDEVLVIRVPAGGPQIGDVVVVAGGERQDGGPALPLTHRLVAGSSQGWRTKGDNRLWLDPPVSAAQIFGWVVARERRGVQLDLRAPHFHRINPWLGRLSAWEAGVARAGAHVKAAPLAAWPLGLFRRLLISRVNHD